MFATINHLDEKCCSAKKAQRKQFPTKVVQKLWPDRCTKQDVATGLQTLLRCKSKRWYTYYSIA